MQKKFFHSTFIEIVCYVLAIFALTLYIGELRAETTNIILKGNSP